MINLPLKNTHVAYLNCSDFGHELGLVGLRQGKYAADEAMMSLKISG